jgi:enoyl-CoA hydratase/carnithine racemase
MKSCVLSLRVPCWKKEASVVEQCTDVQVKIDGAVGRITLTRTNALNALSHDMALAIEKALIGWINDSSVKIILIEGDGDRAFCAGGDVNWLYNCGLDKNYAEPAQFWRDEYRLNELIASYPKPFFSFMHGLVMGGGVGISAHCSHRIVTDSSMIAMPECSIGLVPDVGGSLLLANAPGYLGEYLALTSYKMNAADAIFCSFADYFVSEAKLEDLKKALVRTGDPDIVFDFVSDAGESILSELQKDVDEHFCLDSVDEICASMLNIENESWSVKSASQIQRNSVLSAIIALNLIRKARKHHNLYQALADEYRFVSRALEYGEFLEGVRAAVIDKDRKPQWKYKTISDVPANLVSLMLSEPDDGDIDKLNLETILRTAL